MSLFHDIKVDEEGSSAMLHRFLSRAFTNAPCKNCQHCPCLHGSVLSKDNFVKDALVTIVGHEVSRSVRKTISIDEEGEKITYSPTTPAGPYH